ncbi:MAG: ABC transporter permease [Faecalibacterium prausnitzii]|jgi:putative ABC transport system permease protein|nr:ABC transporter permease [Faecalibacterium prausnitzii]
MILETFRQALQNVWSNKLRTFLTMLGIIIGVMAVIVIVGLGNGMMDKMKESFAELGTNTITVSVWSQGARSVSVDEMYKIVDKHPDLLENTSPQVDFNGTVRVGTKDYRQTNVMGVNEEYSRFKSYTIAQGRGLQYMDIKDNKQVCVIGAYLNRVAYGGNAVGQTLKIGANKFRIVGVLDAKVSDLNGQMGSGDDVVLLPYSTVLRLSQQSTVSQYLVIMKDENQAAQCKAVLDNALMDIFKSDDSFYVYSMIEWLEQQKALINMVVIILTAIASISLLVGGIGIMNIMLVSVTERTREIGIRKAMGAKERVILAQFVTEAATTSALGGVLGIVLGYMISGVANQVLPMFLDGESIAVAPSVDAALVAFAISVGIGILFGYLPARRAARLNPIEALRYD